MTQQTSATPGGPIQIGDLAMQIRACCALTARGNGKIGTVHFMRHDETYCRGCRTWHRGIHIGLTANASGGPIEWVKRIPPLSELEGTKTEEDIREPA